MRDSIGAQAACTLVDISSDGFRAQLDSPIEFRLFDRLISHRHKYEIDVRWSSGKELGGVIL